MGVGGWRAHSKAKPRALPFTQGSPEEQVHLPNRKDGPGGSVGWALRPKKSRNPHQTEGLWVSGGSWWAAKSSLFTPGTAGLQ